MVGVAMRTEVAKTQPFPGKSALNGILLMHQMLSSFQN